MVNTHLERVEVAVAAEVHLVRDPVARTLVLCVETHEEHRVERVDDRVADATCLRQVGALAADRVVLVRAHRIPL